MSKELFTNLGFKVIKEQHHIDKGKQKVGLCVKFESEHFVRPKYSPEGLSFVECKSGNIRNEREIQHLDSLIKTANLEEEYTKRLGGKIEGGIIVYGGGGEEIPKTVVSLANTKGFYCWDIHRIFFYAMKIFSHSILENWVSESKLGFVLNEAKVKKQLESELYFTTRLIGVRFSEMSDTLDVYCSYFVDCLKDPQEATLSINSLHKDHVQQLLDDVYENLEWISNEFYPCNEKNVTVEIHSLSGFTEDAEYGVKLYAPHYKNWKKLNIKHLKVDEHTLFKYSVIPWEAVMDYAFTKRTRQHTSSLDNIYKKLLEIESNFAYEFYKGVKSGDIKDQFTNKLFVPQENKSFLGYQSIYHAHVTKIPIKQRLILFSRTSLKDPKLESMKGIIEELKKDTGYNYTWAGLLSGAGFKEAAFDYVNDFNTPGIGFGLIDAVTKKIYVNRTTEEGKILEKMFLSECIS